jgi:hypothetical protein
VLTEIKEQLRAFQNYAEQSGKSQIAESYRKVSIVIEDIIREKESSGQSIAGQEAPDDEIFKLIMDEAKSIG